MYLLDTNVISELRKKKPHGAVVAWVQSVPEHELFISAVTIAQIQRKIQAGIEITREQDTAKAEEIERWLDLVAQSYNVLDMDVLAFRTWAKLMHRTSDTLYEDAMIASIAKTQNLTVVTRNVTDFKTFGVEVFNPFEN